MKNYIVLSIALAFALFAKGAGYKIGDSAKDFSLKNVDGKMVSMSDMKAAKGYIVIFTCNHCPFSKAYEERIIGLNAKYANSGFPVIAINSNDVTAVPEDSYENMVSLANDNGYTFPYLYDESQAIASAYGASRTPHVFVLQKIKDKLVVQYIGAIDNNTEEPLKADKKYVEDAVDALLNSKPVVVSETKAIGCTIKWKSN